MRLTDIRKHVRNEYLKNDVISGAEAKDLIQTVAGDGLSVQGKKNLEKIRAEFKDSFSEAGLREFDKLLAKAAQSLPSTGGTGGSSAVDVLSGRALPEARSITLASVENDDVRKALRRLDFNNDGKVNTKDRDKFGFDDGQWRSFLFMAALMGQRIESPNAEIPGDLTGKKIAFTAVPDKDRAKKWAEKMGATVVSDLSADVDFLVVGNAAATAKDERAAVLNTLGEADIKIANYETFSRKASEVGATGSGPDPITGAQLHAKIDEAVSEWYRSHIEDHYEYELGEATTDAERSRILADRQTDLDAGAEWEKMSLDNASWFESVDDGDVTDRLGRPLNRSDLVEVAVSFFPEYAGIGLGTYFLVDKRTGDVLDQGDIVD